MSENYARILITKKINSDEVLFARDIGLEIDCIPFIEISPKSNLSYIPDLINKKNYDGIIFTSKNAIEALKVNLGESEIKKILQGKTIYSVGRTTARSLAYFDINSEYPEKENSSALVNMINRDKKIKNAVYFCGNLRRSTVPDLLIKEGIVLDEIEVYETRENNPDVKDVYNYDGIGFYSPSAADSFFNQYSIDKSVPLFAIGPTTKDHIINKVQNPVIMTDTPGTRNLLTTMNEYFNR